MTQNDQDRIALMLAAALAVFVIVSITTIAVLAITGADIADEWNDILTIASGILGLLGGYAGGLWMGRRERKREDVDTDPTD